MVRVSERGGQERKGGFWRRQVEMERSDSLEVGGRKVGVEGEVGS